MLVNSRVSTLESYDSSHRRYDSFKNFWDVCQWFHLDDENDGNSSAPMDTDDDDLVESWGGGQDGGEIEGDDDNYDAAEEQAAHANYISNRTNELSTQNAISWPTTSFRSEIEMDLTANLKPFDLLQHLQLFQGFVPPLQTNSSSWTRQDWEDAMKTIGWYNNSPLKDFEAIIIQFIKDWISTSFPPANCDFNPNNYHAIIPSKIQAAFKYMTLPKGLFLYGKHRVLYNLGPEYLKNGADCP